MEKPVLRRVGLVLLVASIASLAWTIWDGRRTHSYDFSQVVALFFAAVAMLRGGVATADNARRVGAFALGALGVVALFPLFDEPVSLLWARWRLDTEQMVETTAYYILAAAICIWVVRQLSQPTIMAAGSGRFAGISTRWAFTGGIGFALLLGAILLPMTHGRTGDRAISTAEAQLGTSFRYHLSGLGIEYENGAKHVSGTVTAWNDFAVVEVPFAWDE
jgi:uncharacterized membrane protein YqjE